MPFGLDDSSATIDIDFTQAAKLSIDEFISEQ